MQCGPNTHRQAGVRRLELLLGIAILCAVPACSRLPEDAAARTYVYKRVAGLEIRADVYNGADGPVRPVAVWIHGGALIMGRRESVPPQLRNQLVQAGFAVVSIDYRLAPETKLPAILEDVEDAFDWIRNQGPALFRADRDRVVVLGSSAGGYLTLATGHRVRPRPAALVSFWGYGDLIGPWYSTPSPHERHHRVVMTREEAQEEVTGPPISNAADRLGNGGAFYQHCRQHGIWPREVSGWDPHEEAERFGPYMPVENVTRDYPPTLLVHGTADTDVPYEQSVLMQERFLEHGVRHELMTFEGAEHGLGGAGSPALEQAYSAAVSFVQAEVAR